MVTCVISSGDLPLRLEWLFEGSPKLPEGVTTYTHGEDDLSLRIASAAPSHAGNYTCVARNQAAQVSHEAALIVHGTASLCLCLVEIFYIFNVLFFFLPLPSLSSPQEVFVATSVERVFVLASI